MSRRLSLPLGALLLALTGCAGTGDPEVDRLGPQAHAAMLALRTMRVQGTIVDGGQRVHIDLAMNRRGNCRGRLATPSQGSFRLMRVNGAIFIKPDKQFWRSHAGANAERAIAAVGNRWAKIPATRDMASIVRLCDLRAFVAQAFRNDDTSGASKGAVVTIGGQPAQELVERRGAEEFHGYIAVRAPHRLLRICKTRPSNDGCLTFSAFDQVVGARVPVGHYVDFSR